MTSPFPGMDPFIESQCWLNFHGDFVVGIKQHLAPLLGQKYYPFTVRYEVLEYQNDVLVTTSEFYPDVGITKRRGRRRRGPAAVAAEGPIVMKARIPDRVPHYRIEIRAVRNREIVTVLEVLSPTNKCGAGRKKYLSKRRRLLMSSVHLVELDLLLHGRRLPMAEAYPNGDCFALLSRAERRPFFDVWPVTLDQALPTIPIPLLEGDDDVSLPLDDVFRRVFDLGCYRNILDYKLVDDLKLKPDQESKVKQILRRAHV